MRSKKSKISKKISKISKKIYKISKKKNNRRSKKNSRKKLSTKEKCKKYLQKKIKINMSEYKLGRYKSHKQALAVSYSQAKKKYPRCRSVFK